MIRLPGFALCVGLSLYLANLDAATPTRGLWWNPNESGRGYVIDRQGPLMTLNVYAYDTAGNAEWYIGAGILTSAGHFETVLSSFTGGQCFGCAYAEPNGTQYGEVSIDFDDNEHAVLNFPNGSVPIEHYLYGYGSKEDQLLGYWSFTAAVVDGDVGLPQTVGEYLAFTSHVTAADGTVYVSGTGFLNPDVTVRGSYSTALGGFLVDVTLPDGTEHHYQMEGDDNSMIGMSNYGPNTVPTEATANRLDFLFTN